MKIKRKTRHLLNDIFTLTIAAIILAFAQFFFVYSNQFAPGGVSGIVNMVNHFIGLKVVAPLVFGINLPMLVLSFIFLKKEFAIKTTVLIILESAFLQLLTMSPLPQFSAQMQIVVGETVIPYIDYGRNVIAAAFAGAMVGISMGMMFKIGGSTGGTDIVAAIFHKKNETINISWLIFIINGIIIALSIFVYSYNVQTHEFALSLDSITPVLLSMIYILCSSKMSDIILAGGKTALKFEVITKYPDEIAEEIMKKLHHAVTVVNATGMYSKKQESILICIVSRRQITEFKRILSKYSDTFTYHSTVTEVIGKFYKPEDPSSDIPEITDN